MPNVVAIQELNNGPRNLVLKLDIEGDGVTELEEFLVEVGNYTCDEVRLDGVQGHMDTFSLDLVWDGPTEAHLFTVNGDLDFDQYDWSRHGGLTNPKVAGYSGDVLMRSRGLGNGEIASLVFRFVKKRKNTRAMVP